LCRLRDGSRSTPTKRLVLVTQRTTANRALGQVIASALIALGGREDMTIFVSAPDGAVRFRPPARIFYGS
jgi:hypothetical protein